MAILMATDGQVEWVDPESGSCFTLQELQELVGGHIETVHTITQGVRMVVNDEGRLIGLPLNGLASILARQTIVGDVLLCVLEEID